jgi:drug/metabolite transporter (DMT)-like permease
MLSSVNGVLSLVVAFVGYSLLNIAQAGQKIGLARVSEDRTRGMVIWVIATIGTSVAFFVILGAISLGSVSLVGAMAGTGLVSLAVFSHFVMKEELVTQELAALAAVMIGTVFVGAFAGRVSDGAAGVRIRLLWGILASGSAVYGIAWIVTRKMRYTGAVVGGFSGFLGAYSQLFQELGTSTASPIDGLGAFAVSLTTNPTTLVWAGLSVVSMLVLQFSYRHARAIEIIPSFVGNFIAVPVIGGVIIFGQVLAWPQWIGVAMIVAGAVVLGRGHSDTSHGDSEVQVD